MERLIYNSFTSCQFYFVRAMRSYRPPRVLTQADVVTTPKVYKRFDAFNSTIDKKVTIDPTPKWSIRLQPINPEHKDSLQPLSRHSVSLNNLNGSNGRPLLDSLNRNLIKNVLSESYSKQMQLQLERKLTDRKEQIRSEREYLARFEGHSSFETEKKKKIRQEYKQQLQSEIRDRKVNIDHAKTEETSLEKMYQQPRAINLEHKAGSFKKFYEQASKYQSRVEEQYKGYMKKEEAYITSRNKDKISDYRPHYDLMVHQKLSENKLEKERRMELKRILDQQIENKQKERREILEASRYRMGVQDRYDPIVNPIDFKMDIGNRYVMGELARKAQNTADIQ